MEPDGAVAAATQNIRPATNELDRRDLFLIAADRPLLLAGLEVPGFDDVVGPRAGKLPVAVSPGDV
jgi:hypothetical protein